MKKHLNVVLLSVSALMGLVACSTNVEDSNVSSEPSSSNVEDSKDSQNVTSSEKETPSSSSKEGIVTTITINEPASKELVEGDVLRLTATITNEVAGAKIQWISSNTQIATIDENGNLTAIKEGEVSISAKYNEVTSSPITFTIKKKEHVDAYGNIMSLLRAADALDSTKISSLILTNAFNEYNLRQDETTKEWINDINMSKETDYSSSFYSNDIATIETTTKEKGENDRKTLHTYGKAHDLFIDAVSDFSNEQYSFSNLKSNSYKMTDNTPISGEISNYDANMQLTKGIYNGSNGAIAYIIDNFFSNDSIFASSSAKENATFAEENNVYTIASEEITKDSLDANVYNYYSFSFTFDDAGYLLSANGKMETYNSSTEDGSKGRKTGETIISLRQTLGERSANNEINLEDFFLKNKRDITVSFAENPYGSAIDTLELGTKYFITKTAKLASISLNIDKVTLSSVTKNGVTATNEDYTFDDPAITFKKAGEYVLTFKSTLVDDITLEANFEDSTNNAQTLSWASKPSYASTYNLDTSYLPEAVLAGDIQFSFDAEPYNADDDSSVEFVSNEIGATVTKNSDSFSYTMHTSNGGKVSLKGKCASGAETEVKEVTVFANTDEGIKAFLVNKPFFALNETGAFSKVTFLENGDVNYEGSSYNGTATYEVKNGAVTVNNSKSGLKYVKVTPGTGYLITALNARGTPGTVMYN